MPHHHDLWFPSRTISERRSRLNKDGGRRYPSHYGGQWACLVGTWADFACWRIKDVSLYDPQAYGPHTFFTTGFPRFLSIRGARGLLALNQALI
jgi:hypothetical protein